MFYHGKFWILPQRMIASTTPPLTTTENQDRTKYPYKTFFGSKWTMYEVDLTFGRACIVATAFDQMAYA